MALEVLAAFKISHGIVEFYQVDFIKFQTFDAVHRMSLTNFSVQLGLYDVEFTQTLAYNALLISRPIAQSQEVTWRRLSTDLVCAPVNLRP